MHKVLVVAYYFPPLGGAGVQRTLKFTKYLPEFGWQPFVLSVNPKGARLLDPSLAEEIPTGVRVYRTNSWIMPAWLPWRARNIISRWVLMVDEQTGWLPFAIKQGQEILRANDIDAVYTTSAPYTDHLIGYRLEKSNKLPWVADFRDAWIGNFGSNYPTRLHHKLSAQLEKLTLAAANRVTVVSEPIRQGMLYRHPDLATQKIITLTNGYDPADFQGLDQDEYRKNDLFTITYSGTFYAKNRTPDPFLKAVRKILSEEHALRQKIQINFVGNIGKDVIQLIQEFGLQELIHTTGYLSHRDSISYLIKSDLLLLVIGSGTGSKAVMTGKIFEYLATSKPILALAPDGAASELIQQCGAGSVVDPDDVDAIAGELIEIYKKWESGAAVTVPNMEVVRRFDRRKLTQKLAGILEEALGSSRRD